MSTDLIHPPAIADDYRTRVALGGIGIAIALTLPACGSGQAPVSTVSGSATGAVIAPASPAKPTSTPAATSPLAARYRYGAITGTPIESLIVFSRSVSNGALSGVTVSVVEGGNAVGDEHPVLGQSVDSMGRSYAAWTAHLGGPTGAYTLTVPANLAAKPNGYLYWYATGPHSARAEWRYPAPVSQSTSTSQPSTVTTAPVVKPVAHAAPCPAPITASRTVVFTGKPNPNNPSTKVRSLRLSAAVNGDLNTTDAGHPVLLSSGTLTVTTASGKVLTGRMVRKTSPYGTNEIVGSVDGLKFAAFQSSASTIEADWSEPSDSSAAAFLTASPAVAPTRFAQGAGPAGSPVKSMQLCGTLPTGINGSTAVAHEASVVTLRDGSSVRVHPTQSAGASVIRIAGVTLMVPNASTSELRWMWRSTGHNAWTAVPRQGK